MIDGGTEMLWRDRIKKDVREILEGYGSLIPSHTVR